MTSRIKTAAVGFFGGAMVSALILLPTVPPAVAAADPVPQPAQGEQYKVVSVDDFPRGLEDELNRHSSEGWKVRTGAGNAVIMYR